MAGNSSLRKAKQEQNGEFYTQLEDIEKELCNYTQYFNGKTVFCNCDDPYESNFFYYFATRFNDLKLKKLICTCYDGSPMAYTQLAFFDGAEKIIERKDRKAYKIVITEVKDENNDGAVDIADVEYLLRNKKNVLTKLNGNGDFRSEECVALLKEADIVVTNPPFALFREYVAQLVEHEKKFLIIGNVNALTYKDIFKLIKDNRLWIGQSIHSGDREFRVPASYPLEAAGCRIDEYGIKYIRVKGVRWFTNLDYRERHENFISVKSYNAEEYRRYFNFNAINIDKTIDIPEDYFEEMGVPITFLDKYNPEQFDIIGLGISSSGLEIGVRPYLFEHKKYRKEIQHKGAVDGDLYMLDKDGHPDVPYARIIIKRKR